MIMEGIGRGQNLVQVAGVAAAGLASGATAEPISRRFGYKLL
jgi:hypothetical protein